MNNKQKNFMILNKNFNKKFKLLNQNIVDYINMNTIFLQDYYKCDVFLKKIINFNFYF